MRGFLRQLISFGLAAAVTVWILFRAPSPNFGESGPEATGQAPLRFDVVELVENLAAAEFESETTESEAPEPDTPEPVPVEPEPVPPPVEPLEEPPIDGAPPKEAGSRSGVVEEESAAASLTSDALAEETDSVNESEEAIASEAEGPKEPTVQELAQSSELVKLAHAELSGEAALGFSTVLISDPEDQLDIARAFGEEIVLVPRDVFDPGTKQPRYWRIDPASLERGNARISAVDGRFEAVGVRQHRPLVAYEYARLPKVLRELRQRVIRRDDIFLFSALIPPREWAVVIGRRREALDARGLHEDDIEQIVLRYVRVEGGFDVSVDTIVTVDGRTLEH